MDKTKEKYYIGLDIGSDSVGYAVTDENYNIIKINNVSASGVRIVDPASSKAERRTFRSNRRRMERKKYRLLLLRQIFQEEILKTDPSFFKRLEESFFYEEDKQIEGKYSLFFDPGFTDKQFFKKFPTIYHLKQYLINANEKPDIRWIYLAVHHYIKYRGHFLLAGDDMNAENNLKQLFEKVNLVLRDIKEKNDDLDISYFDLSRVEGLDLVFASNDYKKDKKLKTKEILNVNSKHLEKLIDAMYGSDVKVSDLFMNENYSDLTVSKVSFSKSSFDEEDAPVLEAELEDDFELILALKAIYNYIVLKQILGDYSLLTDAMVNKFNKHNYDLKVLKNYFKNYLSDYDNFVMFKAIKETDKDLFNDEKYKKSDLAKLDCNYSAYVGMAKVKKQKYAVKKCKKEDFYKLVKGYVLKSFKSEPNYIEKTIEILNKNLKDLIEKKEIKVKNYAEKLSVQDFLTLLSIERQKLLDSNESLLNEIESNPEKFENARYILTQIEIGNFMPKQTSQDNTVIPYQINKIELELLLNNVSKFYPFLNDEKTKIIQILKYRIPYYVGPLHTSDDKNVYSWVERNSFEKVTPWNFDEVINKEKSNEKFIEKLINYCTYLHSEKVIAKNTLLYSKFMIFNELNKLKINNENISVELKNQIFENVFKKYGSVSLKTLKNWLIENGIYSKDSEIKFIGLPDETKFIANYSSYHKLKKILGEFVDKNEQVADEIIEFITIYGSNKSLLETKLKNSFEWLTSTQLKQLINLNFTGWSSLSKKLLVDLMATDKQTGEKVNIMYLLKNTNQNLMEILNNKDYNFKELIENENPIKQEKLSYDIVDELYISPLIKRVVWQAIKIVDEIIKLKGYKPDKIFVEVTRTNSAEKTKTVSRKKKLLDAYKEFKKNIDKEVYDKLMEELEGQTDESLRREEVYLYFLQQGKSAYSGEKLELNDLHRTCDIDHIIPQWLIKDDSIDNKVLVLKEENQHLKGDVYPLPEQIQTKMKKFWFAWNNIKLNNFKFLSDEKLARLTKTTELSDNELTGFINRQLVATNQAVDSVINIIKHFFVEKETDVVYSKAENVREFRARFELTKIREINDFHHAKDAYLNIVVGNVLNTKFGNDIKKYIIENKYKLQHNKKSGYNIIKVFDYDVIDKKTDKKVWSITAIDGLKSTKDIVKENYYSNDVIVTHTAFKKSGQFYDIGLVSKSEGLTPIKTNDERYLNTEKYGGYNSLKNESYFIIKFKNEKDEWQYRIDCLPILISNKIKQNKITFKNYVQEIMGFKEYELICQNINPYSLININNVNYYIASTTSSDRIKLVCAEQLKLPENIIKLIKPISFYNKINPNNSEDIKIPKDLRDKITDISTLEVYDYLIEKLEHKPYSNVEAFKNNILPLMKNARPKFLVESLEKKCYLIGQIIKLLHRNTSGADLRLINGRKQSGVIMISRNLPLDSKVYLINHTTAGLRKNITKITG